MKNRIRQVFHSGKFITGFVIFIVILLTILIYPLIITRDPLEMMGEGNFFEPGTYVSKSEVAGSRDSYHLNVEAAAAQVDRRLKNDTRGFMAEWLEKYGGVKSSEIDVSDADGLIALWQDHYDPAAEQLPL